MSSSDARIRANQLNAQKSTGPRTEEGKERSRANAYKHGLTGAGVVVPELEAAEIDRRQAAFIDELKPSGEVGAALARHAATMSIRMERCVAHENVALTERARQAEADFVTPEGVDEAEARKLRALAGRLAMFDPSKEACLARRYEATAIRCFFAALKELRRHEVAATTVGTGLDNATFQELMGSLLQLNPRAASLDPKSAEIDRLVASRAPMARPTPSPTPSGDRVDVPFTIGRAR